MVVFSQKATGMELKRLLMREMMNTCREPGQEPASRICSEDKLSLPPEK